ncbi:ABC transporter G family member [Musa troglodytarum]|uniref:ABC transporter G family member n=1 Tax=Musa troglodytarum TaxID=320322 RepID=A0A9E7HUX8_9LILI|nr:ABC transporter G family member [Musa troglodytarum]URE37067.1 ABC transporter G family member [Musa troglodytarum]
MTPHQAEPETGGGHNMDQTTVNSTVVPYPTGTARPGPRPPQAAAVFPITLKFEEVVYKVRVGGGGWWRRSSSPAEKTILNGITGVVCPGEMLAMLGPSGSGKTTLLTALGGRLGGKLSGKITYNGHPFSGAIKRRAGFVAQDDVLYPHLTVTETLTFTALLRLPGTLTRAEKAHQAQQVISELGLSRVAHSMIGGARGVRGVSGGERKRVSIALELLVDPSLLLLDEPTSGLDSTTAARIVGTLKRLAAEKGRTVVTTIHQPSSRLYRMFDKLVLLSEGSAIYYGRAAAAVDYFAVVGFASPIDGVNPADLLLDLANGIAPDSNYASENGDGSGGLQQEKKAVKEALIGAYDRNIATRLKAELCAVDLNNYGYTREMANAMKREQWCTSWWEQFTVLLSRGLKERRHEAFNKLRIFQVLSVATLGGLLWWHTPTAHIQDRTALIFFFSVFWGFFPLYNAVFTFPQERPMLRKEQASGMYRLSSYFLARTAGDLPMELALPTAFTFIIYWMGGLKPDPVAFLLSLLVVLFSVLVAQSLGLAVGAILMDVKQATTLASVTTLVFLMAGGYYVQQIPPFIVWLKYLSYSFYCYKLLLGVQFSQHAAYECSTGVMCPVIVYPAIKSVGLGHVWIDVCIMGLMLVGYRLVAYLALHHLQRR